MPNMERFAILDGLFPSGNPSPDGAGARAKARAGNVLPNHPPLPPPLFLLPPVDRMWSYTGFPHPLRPLSVSKARAQCWTAERVARKPGYPFAIQES